MRVESTGAPPPSPEPLSAILLPHSFSEVDTRVHNTVLTAACGTKSKFNSMVSVSWLNESNVTAAPAQIFKVLISDQLRRLGEKLVFVKCRAGTFTD